MKSFLITRSKIYSLVYTVQDRDPVLLIFENLCLKVDNHILFKSYLFSH